MNVMLHFSSFRCCKVHDECYDALADVDWSDEYQSFATYLAQYTYEEQRNGSHTCRKLYAVC